MGDRDSDYYAPSPPTTPGDELLNNTPDGPPKPDAPVDSVSPQRIAVRESADQQRQINRLDVFRLSRDAAGDGVGEAGGRGGERRTDADIKPDAERQRLFTLEEVRVMMRTQGYKMWDRMAWLEEDMDDEAFYSIGYHGKVNMIKLASLSAGALSRRIVVGGTSQFSFAQRVCDILEISEIDSMVPACRSICEQVGRPGDVFFMSDDLHSAISDCVVFFRRSCPSCAKHITANSLAISHEVLADAEFQSIVKNVLRNIAAHDAWITSTSRESVAKINFIARELQRDAQVLGKHLRAKQMTLGGNDEAYWLVLDVGNSAADQFLDRSYTSSGFGSPSAIRGRGRRGGGGSRK